MTGFGRALRGELYAWTHRRNVRGALLLVFAAAALRVAFAAAVPKVLGGAGAHANFWPRFAEGARSGLILAEVLALVILAGALPREIGLGAARDPLVRRISRSAFVLARALAAAVFPLVLALAAALGSGLLGAVFFDGGHVVTPGPGNDPAVAARFDAWMGEHGLDLGSLAEWNELAQDTTPEQAFEELGLQPFELPFDYFDYVPYLVFRESEVRGEVLAGLARGLLPLLALGMFAFFLSTVLASPALAFGAALGSVLLFGVFLAPELGERSWWVFADWLPGMGSESMLQKSQRIADGYSDIALTAPAALRASWVGSGAAAGLFLILSLLSFRRRRL